MLLAASISNGLHYIIIKQIADMFQDRLCKLFHHVNSLAPRKEH